MKRYAVGIGGLLALILLLASTPIVQHVIHRGPPPPERIELRVPKTVVPMALFGGRPVVSVRVNSKGPFKFILDTGAEGTVVGEELAHELGLPDKGRTRAGRPGAAAPAQAIVTRIETLELGEAQVSGLFAVSLNLSNVWTGSETPRGVLSAAAFPGLLITLDYPARQIELWRGELPAADGQSIFEWDAGERLPSVPLTLNDVKLKAQLDSGSAFGISLPRKYVNSLRLASKPVEARKEKTVDGQSAVFGAKLDGLAKIGQFTIESPQVRFTEGQPAANIGSEVLQQFSVTLDSKNRRVRLEAKPGPE
jgi:Aspartyl protease